MKYIVKLLKIFVPLGIGIYLTWYFIGGLSEHEFSEMKNSILTADYFWILTAILIAFLSHVSRARRWILLVEPLGYNPKLSNAFHGVMSCYIINYTIPRSGEFARAGLMAKYENIPFVKGFATIVVERFFDLVMLGIVVLITGFVQVNTKEFQQIGNNDSGNYSDFIPWIVLGILVVTLIASLLYLKNKRFRAFFKKKMKGIWEGLSSFKKMKRKWQFYGHTLFIWICYIGGVWIFSQAFEQTRDMTLGCVLGAFTVGAAAIALVPGGLGAYPLGVNSVLVLYGIKFEGFGIFMWVVLTCVIVFLGLLSLFLIQRQETISNSI